MKIIASIIIVLVLLSLNSISTADEGMWMPHQMQDLHLDKLGLEMDPAKLYKEDGLGLMNAIVNLGGGVPGVNLMSNEGNPMMYNWCLAEDNENSPWTPFHTETGFKPDESCVTVFSGGWLWLESWNKKGIEGLIQQLKLIPAPFGAGIIISPDVAKTFAKEGLKTREDLQEYLWNHTTQSFREWSDTTWYGLMKGAAERVYRGRTFWPPDYFTLPPEAIVKTYARPEHIHIIVATRGEVVVKLQLPSTVSVDKWR